MKIATYNKKEFLAPDSIRSMAAYHAKILPTGEYMFRIHDCNTGIRLRGDITDKDEVVEAIEKLRALATGAAEFADFIEWEYYQDGKQPDEFNVPRAKRNIVKLVSLLSNSCGFTYNEVVAENRLPEVHIVRQLIYMQLRKAKYSFPQIGRVFNRSHATILCAVRRAEELFEVKDSKMMYYAKKIEHITPKTQQDE